jgi:hypothetical protein
MARTTRKSKANHVSRRNPPPAVGNGPLGEVLTRAEAVAYLRQPENEVMSTATTQNLPGWLLGGEWRSLKTAIERWLRSSACQPTTEMRKAATLQMAGTWKDDLDALPILEDAMRRRGSQPGPDGSYAGYSPAVESKKALEPAATLRHHLVWEPKAGGDSSRRGLRYNHRTVSPPSPGNPIETTPWSESATGLTRCGKHGG